MTESTNSSSSTDLFYIPPPSSSSPTSSSPSKETPTPTPAPNQSSPSTFPSSKLQFGTTVQKNIPEDSSPNSLPQNSWQEGISNAFRLRIGPKYSRYQKKAPSNEAFYRPIACDFIKTDHAIDHVAQHFDVETFIEEQKERFQLGNNQNKQTSSPSLLPLPLLFIVNCQLPEGEPSMFSSADDGPGRHCIIYFALRDEIVQLLLQERNNIRSGIFNDTLSPGLKLAIVWFGNYAKQNDMKGRFKVIGMIQNIATLNLSSLITGYNGKPVLINKSGSIYSGDNYVEMDVRVHKFSYLAKKGLNFLSSKFRQAILDIGFTIESRSDDEMPEQLLGCAQLNYLEYQNPRKIL